MGKSKKNSKIVITVALLFLTVFSGFCIWRGWNNLPRLATVELNQIREDGGPMVYWLTHENADRQTATVDVYIEAVHDKVSKQLTWSYRNSKPSGDADLWLHRTYSINQPWRDSLRELKTQIEQDHIRSLTDKNEMDIRWVEVGNPLSLTLVYYGPFGLREDSAALIFSLFGFLFVLAGFVEGKKPLLVAGFLCVLFAGISFHPSFYSQMPVLAKIFTKGIQGTLSL